LPENFPELISYVKANFHPAIHPKDVSFDNLIQQIDDEYFINFYVLKDENRYESFKSKFKPYDRVVFLDEGNRFSKFCIINDDVTYQEIKSDDLFWVSGHNTNDLIEIHEANKMGDDSYVVSLVKEIANTINSGDIFQFSSYYSYHNIIHNKKKYKNFQKNPNYWVIAAGTGGMDWNDFHVNNVIKIGFRPTPDLNGFSSKKELRSFIEDKKIVSGVQINNKTEEIWNFKNAHVGDKIIARGGITKLFGIAEIIGKYYYDVDDEHFKHCLPVKWLNTNKVTGKLPSVWKFQTFVPLSEKEFNMYSDIIRTGIIRIPNSIIPLNQIFYGPPGTGKTYSTINEALRIIDPNFDLSQDRSNIKEKFDDYVKSGQIVFTTFHQSMCYEDFIEGIKPTEADGQVLYEIQDGIFKRLCLNAEEKTSIDSFDDIYLQFIEEHTEDGMELLTPSHKKKFKVKINSKGNCVAIPYTEAATEMVITKDMIHNYLIDGSIRDWKPYTVPISNYIKEKYKLNISETGNEKKNFVIIIDEINRGNVSQIFGELITLIEEDKRKGNEEELFVMLPYSKEMFVVPANIYIIATMNSADRSVEALDSALRRRFTFFEIPPRPAIIAEYGKAVGGIVDGIDLAELLETINSRIEKLLDRDHMIGHSYFLKVSNIEELKHTFINEIIPLLQEYFYGDPGKIGLVLGSGFIEKKSFNSVSFAAFSDYEDINGLLDRDVYHFIDVSSDSFDFNKAINKLLNKSNSIESDYVEE
jgi:5-methylcytosine-specific restriction endonuclease McrBC GTP-binding regulatory subunit McrB